MSEHDHMIPRYIDEPPQILWWEMDEAVVVMLCMILGIAINKMIHLTIVGLVAGYLIGKMKNTKQEGYLHHLAWWHGIPTFDIKDIPHSHIREFTE